MHQNNNGNLMPLPQMGSNDRNAKEIRSKLKNDFSSEGAVSFQYNYV